MSYVTFREPSYITLMNNPIAKISGMQMSDPIFIPFRINDRQSYWQPNYSPIGKMIRNPQAPRPGRLKASRDPGLRWFANRWGREKPAQRAVIKKRKVFKKKTRKKKLQNQCFLPKRLFVENSSKAFQSVLDHSDTGFFPASID